MKVAIQQTNDFKSYIVTTNDGREFIVKNIDEAINLKEELQYSILSEISKQTGLTKEQIRLKAIEMFKGREDIILERMGNLEEDLKNGKNPFLDIDKILKEKEELQREN